MSIVNIVGSWNPTGSLRQKKSISHKNGKFASLHEWLCTSDFTHSLKIKSGIYIQQFISHLIKDVSNKAFIIEDKYITISSGKSKEMDLIFSLDNKIYYREIKSNLNLDSEKLPATFEKIKAINEALAGKYFKEINSACLNPTWLISQDNGNDVNIEGFNSLIEILGYQSISAETHAELGKELGRKIRAAS